jgi:haloalkane dehalogenase
LIRDFSGNNRCIAADHLGLGLSDKSKNFDYLPVSHARNLEALLLELDLRDITLVFGDWGGPIALDFATRYPERILGLLVTNSWCWPVDRDPYYRMYSGFMGGPVGRFLIRRYNFFVGAFLPMVFGDRKKLSPELHERYKAPFAEPADRKGNWVFPAQVTGASIWLQAIEARLATLASKAVAICWGDKDMAFREKELIRWKTLFPGASVRRLLDCGHFVAEERPDAVAEAPRELTGRQI